MRQGNNYMVTYDAEMRDSKALGDSIIQSEWLEPDTMFVNCFPQYSSRITHLLSHTLSYLNLDEPFEVVDLRMPWPTMGQIWDPDDLMYKVYSKYLSNWVWKNVQSYNKYLFIGADAFSEFTSLKKMLNGKSEDYRFALLYKPKYGSFLPDYVGREYEGKLLFQWENSNNPNK